MIYTFIFVSLFILLIGLSPVYASTPIDSIFFNGFDKPNYFFKGPNSITTKENPTYQLNGFDDYLVLESNLPEKLNQLSISVWVKPNYERGVASTMSIVSEKNGFILAINNDKVEKNIAFFSIFDGIKWQSVQTKTPIPEKWTLITATYSEGQIKIFVNGAQEGDIKLNSDYSYTHQYGKSIQNSYNFINSESNIIVGAFDNSLRFDRKIKNNFSGEIDDIIFYNEILFKDQILSSYLADRNSDLPIIQNIQEPSFNVEGKANEFGFIADTYNNNDQKIETIAYEGYKIQKSTSRNNNSGNFQTTNYKINGSILNENKNLDSSGIKISNNGQNPITDINPPIAVSTSTKICHIPDGDPSHAYTVIPLFDYFVTMHLGHGDSLGEC